MCPQWKSSFWETGPVDGCLQTAWKIVTGADHELPMRKLKEGPLKKLPKDSAAALDAGDNAVEAGKKAILECILASCAVTSRGVGIGSATPAGGAAGGIGRGTGTITGGAAGGGPGLGGRRDHRGLARPRCRQQKKRPLRTEGPFLLGFLTRNADLEAAGSTAQPPQSDRAPPRAGADQQLCRFE